MQFIPMTDGGFAIHKIENTSQNGHKNDISAWYDKDGNLIDCEIKVYNYLFDKTIPRKIPDNWHKLKDRLKRIGQIYKPTSSRVIPPKETP